jgi:hypothetical protein
MPFTKLRDVYKVETDGPDTNNIESSLPTEIFRAVGPSKKEINAAYQYQ